MRRKQSQFWLGQRFFYQLIHLHSASLHISQNSIPSSLYDRLRMFLFQALCNWKNYWCTKNILFALKPNVGTMRERNGDISMQKSVHGQYILRVTDWRVLGLSRCCSLTTLMRKKKRKTHTWIRWKVVLACQLKIMSYFSYMKCKSTAKKIEFALRHGLCLESIRHNMPAWKLWNVIKMS